jgi:hypothetical protein
MDTTNPPADPNDWSDEQWIEWLVATDEASEVDVNPSVLKRAANTKSGQVLGQAMLGMANAIYGPKDDDVQIVVENKEKNLDEEPFVVNLDFDNPESSTVSFKPES